MELGAGESKPTPSNPRGYSKRQITILNFFRDRDSKNRVSNSNDDGHFSSWGGETNSFGNNVNGNYKNGIAYNIFKPSNSYITPKKGPTTDEVNESTIMKDAMDDILRFSEIEVHAYTLHIIKIAQELNLISRITAWDATRPNIANMIGWHQFPTHLPKEFYEGDASSLQD